MALQRIENAAGAFTVWGSAIALAANALQWMSDNVALITAITLLCGFVIQVVAAVYNRGRAAAAERRAIEKHAIEMAILRGDMADRRTVERIDQLDEAA